MIIGIAGKMGSGKDSIADVLVSKFGFIRKSMADALRVEAAEMLDTMIAPVGSPDDIRQIVEFDYWDPEAVYLKPTPISIRRLLQWVGTEHRREKDPDYWVNKMRVAIRQQLATSSDIVIPDIRFENEVDLVREFVGQAWVVRRKSADEVRDASAHSHISERFCDEYRRWDLRVSNDGTLSDLEVKVRDIMRCYKELARCSEVLSKPELLSKSEYEGVCGGQIDWSREVQEIAS